MITISNFQNEVRKTDFQGFVVRMVLEGSDMKFEPSCTDFETVLLNVFDVFVKAVSMVPRVETKLYPVEVKNIKIAQKADKMFEFRIFSLYLFV